MTTPTTPTSLLVFETPTILDPLSFTVLGLSAKETSNPIGFFGTGLKYAIAVLLRTGHQISIVAGPDHYSFAARDISFRGTDAKLITLSHNSGPPTDLGFTTDLGRNWTVENAYRELHSNTLDESGIIRLVPQSFQPSTTSTTIIIHGLPIQTEGYSNRDKIFLSTPSLFSCPAGSLHPSISRNVYYKSVKVWTHQSERYCFTYNIATDLELTEDRTVKYDFEWQWRAANILSRLTDPALLSRLFCHDLDKHLEGRFDWNQASNPTSEFLDALQSYVLNHAGVVSASMRSCLERHRGKVSTTKTYTPTSQELQRLEYVVNLLRKDGHEIPSISFVSVNNPRLFGFVHDGQIFLTNHGLARGAGDLAITVLEEYHHAVHNFDDFNREYQDYLLRKVVELTAQKHNVII